MTLKGFLIRYGKYIIPASMLLIGFALSMKSGSIFIEGVYDC